MLLSYTLSVYVGLVSAALYSHVMFFRDSGHICLFVSSRHSGNWWASDGGGVGSLLCVLFSAPAVTVGETEGAMDSTSGFFAFLPLLLPITL